MIEKDLEFDENCKLCIKEQLHVMSKENILAPMYSLGYCVYCLSSIFQNMHGFQNWGIHCITQIFPSFCWRIFSHMMPLDQSSSNKNIWWIIEYLIVRNMEWGPILLTRTVIGEFVFFWIVLQNFHVWFLIKGGKIFSSPRHWRVELISLFCVINFRLFYCFEKVRIVFERLWLPSFDEESSDRPARDLHVVL